MKGLILLKILTLLFIGRVGKYVVTRQNVIDLGKELQPGQTLIYRRTTIAETLEIANTIRRPPPQKRQHKKNQAQNKTLISTKSRNEKAEITAYEEFALL